MEISKLYEKNFEEKNINKPYQNIFSYIDDLFFMLDGYIQVSIVLKNNQFINRDELTEDINRIENHIKNRREKSNNRLIDIENKFSFTNFERFIFLLAFSIEWDSRYESYYAMLNDNAEMKYPNKRLAIILYGEVHTLSFEERDALIWNENAAIKYFLMTSQSLKHLSDLLYLEEGVMPYILYNSKVYQFNREYISIESAEQCDEDLEIYKPMTEQLLHMWNRKDNFNLMIQLDGVRGSGKKHIVKKFLQSINRKMALCTSDIFYNLTQAQMMDKLNKIYANALVMEAVLCLRINIKPEESDFIQPIQDVIEEAGRVFEFSIVLTEDGNESLFQNCHSFIRIDAPILDTGSRYMIWKKFSSEAVLEADLDIALMANKCGTNPGEIKDVIRTAQLYALKKNKFSIGNIELQEAFKLRQRGKLLGIADRINAVYTWKDFIINDKQKEQIIQICNQVKYKEIVEEKWGFQEKLAYGKGTSVLFHGPPGTGKTMAAQIVANELSMELYRVDIAVISSKYIGETEKKLSKLFDCAKNMNVILFFDEADTLFARRSEVKSSNDRHANNVTGHLLQRIEDYEGIVILATNLVESIDEAFIRRIQFMVRFEYPSAELRLKIYQAIIPEKAECAEYLALEYFAEKFEMSGSNIKEVLVQAAYLAASEGEGIKNIHLIKTIKQNHLKYGKVLTNDDFGYLMFK